MHTCRQGTAMAITPDKFPSGLTESLGLWFCLHEAPLHRPFYEVKELKAVAADAETG